MWVTRSVAAALVALCCVWHASSESVAQQGPQCWTVFGAREDGSGPSDSDRETICLTSGTSGIVRESGMFGPFVGQCSEVIADRRGGGLNFRVDLSKCGGMPTHTVACPSPTGTVVKCTWTFSDDNSRMDVYLVPER